MLEQQGIPAIKLNYSNAQYKNVTLRLVKNRAALEYTSEWPAGHPPNLIQKLFRTNRRTVPFSNYYSLVYGGSTSIFKRHRKKLFPNLKRAITDVKRVGKKDLS